MKISKKNINMVKKSLKGDNESVLKNAEVREILMRNKEEWNGKVPIKPNGFINFLKENNIAEEIILPFPNRKEVRFLTKKVSYYLVLLSLSPESYFSHLTAAYLNKLVSKEPKTIYINTEQNKKNINKVVLEQERIDYAFSNPARISNNYISMNEKKIYHLNSMNSGRHGVVSLSRSKNEELRCTDKERTLIDITVRPQYAAGVKNVLEIFTNAAAELNLSKIVTYLKKLNYTYPYHQCIGFYLERTGFDETTLKEFKDMGMEFDFYLCNEIEEPNYSKDWKLYYPSELN